MYKIKIDKVKPNPDYKEPKDFFGIYNQRYDVPALIYEKSLETELTEEEFKAVKKAVIEVM
jgi:hypothetical protein